MVVAGLALVAGALVARSLYTLLWLRTNGQKTEGTILFDNEMQGKGGRSYQPVVQFRDAAGTLRTFDSRSSSRSCDAAQIVTVLYDPINPDKRAEIEAAMGTLILTRVVLIAASISIAVIVLHH